MRGFRIPDERHSVTPYCLRLSFLIPVCWKLMDQSCSYIVLVLFTV